MNKRELKSIIFQILKEDGIGSSAGTLPANATPNIGGYDGPFGMIKRKINKRSIRKRKVKKI